MSFYKELGGGGNVLISNCYDGRCYGKVTNCKLPFKFHKFHCFNARDRVKLFEDSISNCFKVTILPFKRK